MDQIVSSAVTRGVSCKSEPNTRRLPFFPPRSSCYSLRRCRTHALSKLLHPTSAGSIIGRCPASLDSWKPHFSVAAPAGGKTQWEVQYSSAVDRPQTTMSGLKVECCPPGLILYQSGRRISLCRRIVSLFSAKVDLISLGWGVSVLPDGLQTTAGLKIMYVISNHILLKLQRNYIYFHCNLIYFYLE